MSCLLYLVVIDKYSSLKFWHGWRSTKYLSKVKRRRSRCEGLKRYLRNIRCECSFEHDTEEQQAWR